MKTIVRDTLLITALLFTVSIAAKSQSYSWKTVRIGGGGATTSIKAHPRVKDLYFITTDVGNPYRWNKITESWEGLLNMTPASNWNMGACAQLAVDPNDSTGNILYATVGKYANSSKQQTDNAGGKVIKSTDRGTTWKDAGLSIGVGANQDQYCGERLAVDPGNSDVVYVTSRADGTWKGTQAGTVWQKINELNGMFIAFDESAGTISGVTRNLFIGCVDGVYQSIDGGTHFKRMDGSPADVRRAAYHRNGTLYVSATTGVYKWSGSGWKNVSPKAGRFIAIDVNPANSDEVIASPNEGKRPLFYITKDGGRSWSIIDKKPDFSEIPFAEPSHFSLSTFDFCWDPFNPAQIWFTDFFNAYQTKDIWAKQVTWKARAGGHEEIVTLGVLVCPPGGSNELLSCTADLGGFDHSSITAPPATSMYKFFPWTAPDKLSGNMMGAAIQESNPAFIARVGRRGWDGVGLGGYSADGGSTYTQWICPPGAAGGRVAVAATNETMVWVTQHGAALRSADRGATWKVIESLPSDIIGAGNAFMYINPLAADKVSGNKFYVYYSGKFYVSDDGGASFKTTVSDLPVVRNNGFMKVETTPGIEGDIWLSLEQSGLYHSTDAGRSFQKIGNVQYSKLMAAGKAAASVPAIFVMGTVNNIANGIFRSDDNGASWVQIDVPAFKMGMEPNSMAADRITWGKIFIGTNGNGIFTGEPAAPNNDRGLSLDGTWKFKTDPYGKGESLAWFTEGVNDQGWDSLPVPGNWDLLNEYSHYAGKAWYRREVFVSPLWKDKLVRLLFEAVSFNSKVWLNGRLLGSNDNGYLPFEFDVSSKLRYGGRNVITVMCDNTHRIGALWNWGGIRRPVKLVAGENVYVSGQFISPSVDLSKHTAQVAVRVTCRNSDVGPRQVKGEVVLYSKENYKKTLPFSIVVEEGAQADVIVTTAMNNKEVHLWNCDDPFLYQSEVYLVNGDKRELQVSDRFGLRKIELDNKNFLFKLNGEVMRPMGFNLVPDDRTTGSVLPLWRVKQDVDLLKSFGANMARLTHLPLHREMFDYLDEKGILVFSEVPLWGMSQLTDKTNPVPREWLERLVRDHYNHPCIIGWSVGNEIGDSPGVMEYVEDAIRRIRKLDSTRLGVMVSHTATNTTDPLQYSDIGLVNKYGGNIGGLAETMHRLHPDKLLFYSEFGYGQLGENLDSDVDARGMMDSIRFKPWLIGGALWTFNDYRSSYAGNKEFSENRAWGIVDIFRQKKKAWYSFRKEYAPVRALKVQADGSVKNKMLVSIVPRKVLDLPAYVLNDYRLVWQGFDDHGELKDGGFIRLPVIRPGDMEISNSILWKDMSALSSLKIELLSPGNYSVYDTLICLKKPMAPVVTSSRGIRTLMNDVPANSGSIRVTFNKAHPEAAYKVKYGINELSQESALTLNNYVDIPKLPFGQIYKFAVVGVNACGESDNYAVSQIKVDTGFAAPVIYYSEPADKGFYVGYSTEKDDYMFRIQYTLVPGDYSNAETIQATTKGVMFVPGLLNGKQYYFRMCRIKDNNFITPWSEEHVIIPDGAQAPSPPSLAGVLRDGNAAILVFEPVKKAIAYSIEYREKGSPVWQTMSVNASDIRHVRISGLKAKRLYEFRMYCENSYTKSALSPVVTK